MEPERPWSLEVVVAETRAEVGSLRHDIDGLKVDIHELRTEVRGDIALFRSESRTDTASARADLRGDIAELRHDIRRIDDRFFQMMIVQLGTLFAALASVVTAILT